VTSIDKIVHTSPRQAQVLFTIQVISAGRSGGDDSEQQAVGQLLALDNEILVCSYLPRAGLY
jgi:hypothetical protein